MMYMTSRRETQQSPFKGPPFLSPSYEKQLTETIPADARESCDRTTIGSAIDANHGHVIAFGRCVALLTERVYLSSKHDHAAFANCHPVAAAVDVDVNLGDYRLGMV